MNGNRCFQELREDLSVFQENGRLFLCPMDSIWSLLRLEIMYLFCFKFLF